MNELKIHVQSQLLGQCVNLAVNYYAMTNHYSASEWQGDNEYRDNIQFALTPTAVSCCYYQVCLKKQHKK